MQQVDLSVLDILEHGAHNFGTAEVITRYEDGTRVTTFREIRDRAASLSAGLRGLGVSVGDRVGTFAWNTPEHLECYFAVPGMGAVLHTMNPRFSTEQLTWCLQDAQTTVAVVDSSLAEPFADLLTREQPIRAIVIYENGEPLGSEACQRLISRAVSRGIEVRAYPEVLAGHAGEDAFQHVPETLAAALCHTSGTTGNPKGVAYSHRSIWLHSLLNTSAAQFGLNSQDTILPAVPMFHVLGWNLAFSSFMVGSQLILTNRWNQAEPLLQLITEHRPTFAAGVPTIWNDVAHSYDQDGGENYDLSSLQRMSSGGAAVPESLIRWWQQGHEVAVFHGCGMTETSSTMASGFPPGGIDLKEISPYQRTQGQFLIGVQNRIVDDEGRELPRDGEAAGELQLRGPWITGAYLNREETALTEDGWLPTGDIATITHNGYLQYTDRSKDIIKSGGEWISSVALENRLAGYPGIHEAVVIGIDDERWQERPAAILVCHGVRPEIASLKEHLLEEFPKFWIPSQWIFVEEIPRTSVGKYDKKKLRAEYREGALPPRV
ncbi:long-chain-fatty-acid--CoA ligase [Leucobacter japonicus]|uniref:long-chain-fatty-acid--CoA ligase n=1 Tax=Leucobacter japonicus TaxID=1461259 RepID=UPI0012E1BC42|nr:long-chain-fatty-acid--CoA ligase [Leucobacter japonicus]